MMMMKMNEIIPKCIVYYDGIQVPKMEVYVTKMAPSV